MATKEYYKEWLAIKENLRNALADDANLQHYAKEYIGIKPQSGAVEIVGGVYAKFCELYNKLCDIYDQTLQPQRSEYIMKIIEALTCRIMELKSTLEDVEAFEYTYPENALIQKIMIPEQIDILCPFFYPFEIRKEELQYIVDEIMAGNRLGDPTPTPSEIERKEEERLEREKLEREEKEAERMRKLALGDDISESLEEVVYSPEELEEMQRMAEYNAHVDNIQRMERSRTATLEKIQKINKDNNLYLILAGLAKPQAAKELKTRAAEMIQKFYRRFKELKRKHAKDYRLRTKLGMIITSWSPPSQKIQLEKVKEKRREYRREYFKKWVEANVKEKDRIFRLREHDIMEDISDEVRYWFKDWYANVRTFDEYPWPEEGGSILLVKGETMTIPEYIEWERAEQKRLKIEAQNPKSPEDIKAEKRAAKEEQKRLAQEEKEREKKRQEEYYKMRLNPLNDPGVNIRIGRNFDDLQESWIHYENTWQDIDEKYAPMEAIKGHIKQLIIENVFKDLQYELRPIIDEILRNELKVLRNALKRDYDFVGEKLPLVLKRKKPKKPKKPKEEKTPPAKLFQFLVDEGIVVKYPKVTLEDYWGDQNYAAADTRAVLWTPTFPPPCIGDVKQLVRIRCLLAIGSSCQGIERSQLIVGPVNSGKRSLIYAIATETNSILIDLSPMNIYNKCPGAKGLKKMITVVNKVSRIMQPTVIMIDRADKVFYKKVPKEEKMFDLARISKDLAKQIVKPLYKGSDKILLLGTATEPWLANNGKMSKCFPNVIMIPTTDYGSISFILTKLLMKYHGVHRDFNVHSLAQALRGYDIKTIKAAIAKLLTAERLTALTYKPLEPMEVINAVVDYEGAVYTDKIDSDMFQNWYLSYSPMGKKYTDFMNIISTQLQIKIKLDKEKNKKQ